MKQNKNSKLIRVIIITVVILGIGTWTYATLMSNQEEVADRIYTRDFSKAVPVKVMEVGNKSIENSERFLGVFEPNRQITVSSQTQGEVVQVGVAEGETISKGTLIAKVDGQQLQDQLDAANAAFEDAALDLKRYENLVNNNAVAKVQLDKAKLTYANSKSQRDILRKQIQDTYIKAPFSGTLATRTFNLGTVLSPGMPLGLLADVSVVKLVVKVGEERLVQFKKGQQIEVFTEVYPGVAYKGTITMLGALGDESHNFPIHIEAENSKEFPISAGMYGYVNFVAPQKTGISIPVEAMVGSTKDAKVYVIDKNNVAAIRKIQVGESIGSMMQVTSGLENGETIVVSGQINLSDSTLVSY